MTIIRQLYFKLNNTPFLNNLKPRHPKLTEEQKNDNPTAKQHYKNYVSMCLNRKK